MNASVEKKIASSGIFFRVNCVIISTLIIALLMNLTLSALTLEKIYSESLLSEYAVIGRYYAQKIERSLSFGKMLNNFSGMPKFLNTFKEKNPDISQIFIYSDEQKALFRLHQDIAFSKSVLSEKKMHRKEELHEKDKNYHLVFPLFSGDVQNKTLQGYMEIVLFQNLIKEKIKTMMKAAGNLLTIAGSLSAVIFFLIVLVVIPGDSDNGKFNPILFKQRLLLITAMLLILSQLGFSYFNVSDFRERYFNNIQDKCYKLGTLLQADINYLLDVGIPIHNMLKIDILLNDIFYNIPELSDITIVDNTDAVLYQVKERDKGKIRKLSDSINGFSDYILNADSQYRIKFIVKNADQKAGSIHLNISKKVIDKTIRDIVFDAATVVVVSLLVGFEFIFFLVAFIIYSENKAREPRKSFVEKKPAEVRIEIKTSMRTAAFLYAFAMALSMSFLPIYADELYAPMLGLSKEIVIALPLSGEMLLVALSMVVSGYWLDRKGWFWPFISGAIITGSGVWLCGMAETTAELILCRSVVGFGYGLAVMSTQYVVINMTTIQNRSSALAALEAGFFSGFITSTAMGGMLAEKIGFRSVFFAGGVLTIISILFVVIFLRDIRKAGQIYTRTDWQTPSEDNLFSLFKDGDFMGSLVLNAIPSALCLIGFLYFASLLFLSRAGVSQSNIARLIMPYGLCMVYIAPMLNRWVDSISDKRIPVILGGILGGISLMAFYFIKSIPMFVIILVLFSISGCLSYSARISYISEAQKVKSVGVSKSLGLFNSLERIGNIIGPIIVGAMITAIGLSSAISSVGLIYLIATLFFAGLFFLKKAS